ncbi:MAG: hypothetical protein EXR76_07325 [Myxococcales bacterium]|nr:hypothetical protein [Myxococcales bacterium]
MNRAVLVWALVVGLGPLETRAQATPSLDAMSGPAQPQATATLTISAIDALTITALEDASRTLVPGFGAAPYVALRRARLLAHQRDPQGARALLKTALLHTPPSHPAHAALKALNARLETRGLIKSNRIGVALPLSGPYAAIGKAALLGIQVASNEAPTFELVIEDTAGDADRVFSAVDRLVHQHQVAGIIGPVGALESRRAAFAAEQLEVPLISLTGADGITGVGPFVFRHRLTREAQARYLARFAVSTLGLRKFAILYPRNEYGREMMAAFFREVVSLGGEVRAAEGYGPRATEFNVPVARLVGRHFVSARPASDHDERWAEINRKAKDPGMRLPPVVDFEALFIADTGDRARQVLPFVGYWDIELRTHPEMNGDLLAQKYGGLSPPLVQLLGTNGFHSTDFASRAGEAARNSLFLDEFLPDSSDALSFVSAYTSLAGHAPDPLAAHAYDAARMLARAASTSRDRSEVRRKLAETRDFPGACGLSQFDGDGEAELKLNVLTISPEGLIVPWESSNAGASP